MPLLLAHAAVTLVLVGLIWTIQVVHYPLMEEVGETGFARYQANHVRRISLLVVPLMLAELGMAGWIAWRPPGAVPATWAWAAIALLAVIWAATAFLSVPAHERLRKGFDTSAHRRLVRTNWIRTVAWSARGALALARLACEAM